MSEKHSAVCYIFREGAFSPVREAKPFQNDFGLDLFRYKGAVYEGRTGLRLCPLQEAEYLDLFIKSHGGIEKVQQAGLLVSGVRPRDQPPNRQLFYEPEDDLPREKVWQLRVCRLRFRRGGPVLFHAGGQRKQLIQDGRHRL